MSTLRNVLLNALFSRAGTFIQIAVGAGVGWLASQVQAWGWPMSEAFQESLKEWLMSGGAVIVAAIVQYLQARGILAIQETIGAKPDARPMAKTLQQVGKLIDAASTPKK